MSKLTDAVLRMKDGEKDKWETRVFVAIMEDAGCPMDKVWFACIIMKACGIHGNRVFSPLGENATIKKDGSIWTMMRHPDIPIGTEVTVGSIDDLNRALGWLMERILATQEEYETITNKVRAWIVRDERQLDKMIERQRASWLQ